MPIDPRTPVIVGVGQVVNRPAADDASTWSDPLTMMADALERAGADAAGAAQRRSTLLGGLGELTAVPSFVWHVADPALAVAERLGLDVASTRVAFAGGTTPQTLLFDAARRILAGELDVAAVVGAEAIRSRDLARRAGTHLDWPTQDDAVPPAPVYGEVPDAMTDREREAGLLIPVHAYALFEHARRRRHGESRAAHLDKLGRLAARMSDVASRNELAWIRDATPADAITTASASNRMVALPYTKLLTSNVVVDMAAAFVVCSLEAARRARVPDDRLVFPVAGAVAREQWFVSGRQDISRSVAMQACASRLFGPGARGADHVAHLDLYSCFPAVVQMAGEVLGMDLWRDERPPTVTGGMTFFGGPGNNYVTHSIASMTDVLRGSPGATGLVTALGWYCSTHAWGTYSTEPPAAPFFVAHDVQSDVDAVPTRRVDERYSGSGEVESYTVVHDRDGTTSRAIFSVLTADGSRCVTSTQDVDAAAEVERADPLGATVTMADGDVVIT